MTGILCESAVGLIGTTRKRGLPLGPEETEIVNEEAHVQ